MEMLFVIYSSAETWDNANVPQFWNSATNSFGSLASATFYSRNYTLIQPDPKDGEWESVRDAIIQLTEYCNSDVHFAKGGIEILERCYDAATKAGKLSNGK